MSIPDILYKDIKELLEYYKKYDNFKDDWFVFGGAYPFADTNIKIVLLKKQDLKRKRL